MRDPYARRSPRTHAGSPDRGALRRRAPVLAAAGVERPPSRPQGLSPRELEVLRLVARGKSNREIGNLLGISARTVQNHVANLYDKIAVYSRAGATLYAVERGLL